MTVTSRARAVARLTIGITLVFSACAVDSRATPSGDNGPSEDEREVSLSIGPACRRRIFEGNRLDELVANIEGRGKAQRVAVFDNALPKDDKESREMRENSVFLVIGMTHEKSELPFVFRVNGAAVTPMACAENETANPSYARTFGRYERSCFYAVPLATVKRQGRITLDWAKNRKDFGLTTLPLQTGIDAPFVQAAAAQRSIGLATLMPFLEREFCVTSD